MDSLTIEQQALVMQYKPFAYAIGSRIYRNIKGSSLWGYLPFEREDLTQEAIIGMITAAKLFDKSRGIKFTTFSYNYIRGSVIGFVRKEIPTRRGAKINILLESFEGSLNGEAGEGFHEQHLSYNSEVVDTIDAEDRTRPIYDALALLKYKERSAFVFYHMEDLPMREIAKQLSVSKERARQLIVISELIIRSRIAKEDYAEIINIRKRTTLKSPFRHRRNTC